MSDSEKAPKPEPPVKPVRVRRKRAPRKSKKIKEILEVVEPTKRKRDDENESKINQEEPVQKARRIASVHVIQEPEDPNAKLRLWFVQCCTRYFNRLVIFAPDEKTARKLALTRCGNSPLLLQTHPIQKDAMFALSSGFYGSSNTEQEPINRILSEIKSKLFVVHPHRNPRRPNGMGSSYIVAAENVTAAKELVNARHRDDLNCCSRKIYSNELDRLVSQVSVCEGILNNQFVK